jgi:hypothetical protein
MDVDTDSGWDIREDSFLLMGQETLRKRTNKKNGRPSKQAAALCHISKMKYNDTQPSRLYCQLGGQPLAWWS